MRLLRHLLLALLVATSVVPTGAALAAIDIADQACEETTTTGTGTLDLAGASDGGYLGFKDAGIASGSTVYYRLTTGTGASRKIEQGVGTFTDATPDTLTRDASTTTDDPTGAANLTLAAGTHNVCVGQNIAWYGADANGIKADTGDSATSFFSSGTIEDARIDGSAEADEVVLAGDSDGAANANDLDEAAVEAELEGVLDLADLQGSLTLAGDVDGAHGTNDLDEANVETELEGVLDLADMQGDLALGSKTSGNYVDDVTAGAGISVTHTPGEGSDAAVAFDYSDAGADPALSADTCRFSGDATTNGEIVCEGDTANTIETRIVITDPTASDKAFTIPNADSTTCVDADKGDITVGTACTDFQIDANAVSTGEIATDGVSADELNATGVEAELEAVLDLSDLQGSLTLAGDVDGAHGTNDIDEANVETELEGVIDLADLQFSDQGADPALAADFCVQTTDATTAGAIVCEGNTADTIESRIVVTDPTASDKAFTLPNANSWPVTDKDYGDLTVSASGQTWSFDNDTVANAEMADNAIGNAEMADNAVGNAEMADNAVAQAEVGDDAIGINELDLVDGDTPVNGDCLTYDTGAGGSIEAITCPGGSDTLGPDGDTGDIIVGGTGTTTDIDEVDVEAELESVLDKADLQGDLTLAGDVDGAHGSNDIDEANVEAELESVIDEADLQVSDQGNDPALASDRCAYTTDTTTAGNIVCEGDTANTAESRMDFGDPSADRVFTLPDANSYPITDKDYGDLTVSASGQTWNLDADSVGASEISAGAVGSSEAASLDTADVTTGTWADARVDGTLEVDEIDAVQADQETATSTTTFVTPAVQENHPSASKVWGRVTVSGGTPTLQASYNMTSITDTATGRLTITIATDFSTANYAVLANSGRAARGVGNEVDQIFVNTTTGLAVGAFELYGETSSSATDVDPVEWYWSAFGDQ